MNAKEIKAVLEKFDETIRGLAGYLMSHGMEHSLGPLGSVYDALDKHRLAMVEAEAEAAICSRCDVTLCGHSHPLCPACYEWLTGDPVSACHEAAQVEPGTPGIPDSESSDDTLPSWIRLDRIEQRLDKIEQKATEQRIAPTLAHAQVHYDALLRRLADMPTNQPEAKPAFERASTEMHDTPGFTPTNAQLREGARQSRNLPPGPPWNATDDPFTPEPAPPIAVEMWLIPTRGASWTWGCTLVEARLAYWIDDLQGSYISQAMAHEGAMRWLQLLSKQLGVPLVAKWEGKKPMPSFSKDATAKRQERRASGRQSDCSDAPCPPPASG